MEPIPEPIVEKTWQEVAVALTDEQKGFLFLLLKTVIDVLDQKGIKS